MQSTYVYAKYIRVLFRCLVWWCIWVWALSPFLRSSFPGTCSYVRAFSEREHSNEHIEFFVAVSLFKETASFSAAQKIWDEFVREGAPQQARSDCATAFQRDFAPRFGDHPDAQTFASLLFLLYAHRCAFPAQ